jgi:thymidine kinase
MKNEFVMFVGPMFGGKTTKLLSAIDRYKYQGRKILAFKPNVDERYSREEIVTHWGHKLDASRISSGAAISRKVYELGQEHCVVAVDEAFMIPGCGDHLVGLFKLGHTVLVSSLQLSSDFTSYEEMQAMMPYATKIEVCPAVCSTCGSDAHYTEKIGGRSSHKIEVGGAEMYQPRCFSHFSYRGACEQ